MSSLVLRVATGYLLPLTLLYSVFVLLRGHHEPGGGFVGGLVAATAFVLHALSHDAAATRRLLRVDPRTLAGAGLLAALGSGAVPLLRGRPFLTGLWTVSPLGEIGTPLLFDLGVYLLVLGFTLTIVLALAEE